MAVFTMIFFSFALNEYRGEILFLPVYIDKNDFFLGFARSGQRQPDDVL
jgi:hypothetical protein